MAMRRLGEPFFQAYEDAVDSFLRNGGHTPSMIRSPLGLLKQYRLHFAQLPYAGNVRIEETDQESVSVRGTTIDGHDYEWPELA
jgi:hypothetical protein